MALARSRMVGYGFLIRFCAAGKPRDEPCGGSGAAHDERPTDFGPRKVASSLASRRRGSSVASFRCFALCRGDGEGTGFEASFPLIRSLKRMSK